MQTVIFKDINLEIIKKERTVITRVIQRTKQIKVTKNYY